MQHSSSQVKLSGILPCPVTTDRNLPSPVATFNLRPEHGYLLPSELQWRAFESPSIELPTKSRQSSIVSSINFNRQHESDGSLTFDIEKDDPTTSWNQKYVGQENEVTGSSQEHLIQAENEPVQQQEAPAAAVTGGHCAVTKDHSKVKVLDETSEIIKTDKILTTTETFEMLQLPLTFENPKAFKYQKTSEIQQTQSGAEVRGK